MKQIKSVELHVNESVRTNIGETAEALGLTRMQARNCLCRLASYGKIRKVGDGQYASMVTDPQYMADKFIRTPAGHRMA